MKFNYLFKFDKFLTPLLVVIVYWVGLIFILVGSIISFISAFSNHDDIFLTAPGSILALIIGAIIWRVFCESIILLFRIYDRMVEIRERLPATPTDISASE